MYTICSGVDMVIADPVGGGLACGLCKSPPRPTEYLTFCGFFRTGFHSAARGQYSGSLLCAVGVKLRLKCDDTRAETRFRLSARRTNSFKSAGASV
jgi:hypothetical protein